MMKRLIALLLCLFMSVPFFTGCAIEFDDKNSKKKEEDKGAYITMYLTNEVYNFDPAYAFNNEEAESVISMLYTRLFSVSKSGKLEYELAKSYTTKENEKTNEYTLTIALRDTWWSDKTKVTADDVVYAWKRLLDAENSFAAASLLYDIKNARAVKEGDCSIDDLGVYALNDSTLEIVFERPIDYDAFLLNLTSLALAPLREDYVSKGEDWAKKPSTMVTSGPFKLSKIYLNTEEDAKYTGFYGSYVDKYKQTYDEKTGEFYTPDNLDNWEGKLLFFGLERNAYYYRDPDDEDLKLTKEVTPYRILVDCSYSDEQLKEAYQNGEIFFMGDIPVSLRSDSEFIKNATVKDGLSTATIYLNHEALVKNKSTGEEVALFANKEVRQALSLALDRDAIATALVFAEAATGFVPTGIYNQGLKGSFRKVAGELIKTSADVSAASAALTSAGIKASDYSFELTVNPNDDEMVLIATYAAEAWSALGFEVTVVNRGTILNNDYYAPTSSTPKDVADEMYLQDLMYRDYQAIVVDSCAYNQDAYSMLSSFAVPFSGIVDENMNLTSGYSGYANDEYDMLFEAIYYLPYFNSITSADYASFANYESADEFQAILDACSAVYTQYNINTNNATAGRTTLLHEAEKILMDDMVVIPVVFNKTATLQNKAVSGISSDLFTAYNFQKTTLKNYKNYVSTYEQLYAFKTFYVCSCGHQNEAEGLSYDAKKYTITTCEKCGNALTTDNIVGLYPFNMRITDALQSKNRTTD